MHRLLKWLGLKLKGGEKAKKIRKQILSFWKEVAYSIGTKGNCVYKSARRRYEYLENEKMDTICLLFRAEEIARWGVAEIVMDDISISDVTEQIITDGIKKIAKLA